MNSPKAKPFKLLFQGWGWPLFRQDLPRRLASLAKIESAMTLVATAPERGIHDRDVYREAGLDPFVGDWMIKELVNVGFIDYVNNSPGRNLRCAPRLASYVSAQFSLKNSLEDALSDVYVEIQSNISRSREYAIKVANFSADRHKPSTLERNKRFHDQADYGAEGARSAFRRLAGCDPYDYHEHLEYMHKMNNYFWAEDPGEWSS